MGGILTRASGKRRIARRQKNKVIQVGATQAERTHAFNQGDLGVTAKLFAALTAK
jgi:hypothetical protein